MSEITRGKWDWELHSDEIAFTVDGKPLHPTLADAKLICAAPEMYHALKNIVLKSGKIYSASAGVWACIHDARKLLARIDGEQEEKS